MNVIFRTDASLSIGSGHVMRCLVLATELRRRGHHCWFICRPESGHYGGLIADRGFPVVWLYNAEDDATGTCAILRDFPEPVDWLIVDHYALAADWEKAVASFVGRIFVIDDLADRRHECHLLLNQNTLQPSSESPYQGLLNSDCEQLLGPGYALLGPEYSLFSGCLPERTGEVLRMLIFVGGSDFHRLTERYINALVLREFRELRVDVVIGMNYPDANAVGRLVNNNHGFSLHSGLASLAALMVRADLMLGAGGATTWERCCLGLPSLITSVSDNQVYNSQALSSRGLSRFLGRVENVDIETVRSGLRAAMAEPDANRQQSGRMRQLVDGKGCERVADRLLGGSE